MVYIEGVAFFINKEDEKFNEYKLSETFKKVEEPNISLEELKKRFTKKEEKTTMENKFDKLFIEIGKEELIERLLGTPSKVELGVKFEDWARLNIDVHQIPNEMNYNEAIEFCRNKLIFRYLDNQEALNDEQEEKQAKEERKRQYKELKKEFGKGETK